LGTRDTTIDTSNYQWQSAKGAYYGGDKKVEYWLAPGLLSELQQAKTSLYNQPTNRFLKLGMKDDSCIAVQEAIKWSDHRLEMLIDPNATHWAALVDAGYEAEFIGNRRASYGAQGGVTYSDYKIGLILCWRTGGSIARGEPGEVFHPSFHSVMSRDLIAGQGGPYVKMTGGWTEKGEGKVEPLELAVLKHNPEA